MEIMKKTWYRPKNSTHLFLRGFAITATISTIFILLFNQQIRSGISSLRDSIATCPTHNTTATIFSEDENYQTFNSSADKLWKELIPPNGGFIIDESRKDSQVYGISMFHQLHCVQMFRKDFQELYARLEGNNRLENAVHDIDEEHLLHCLDYLRQVFLCYADGLIEPTVQTAEDTLPKTNGMVPRHCGNPDVWYEQSRGSHWSDGRQPFVGHGLENGHSQ